MKLSRKRTVFVSGILISLLFIYWFKFQIGINLFNSFGISAYFPFKYFANKVIELKTPGIFLNEDFDETKIFANFPTKDFPNSKAEIAPTGFNGSRCLLIANFSNRDWVFPHRKKIKVKTGDAFSMEAVVKISGKGLQATLSVAAFDKNDKVIKWNLFRKSTKETDAWINLEKEFIIQNDTINYIQFRLAGQGIGTFRFDNVTFRKL